MERLWAPWRLTYIEQASGPEEQPCVFCGKLALDDREALVLHRGERAFCLLNLYPYANGHLMVAPYRHVARPGDLDAAERAEVWELLDRSIGALERGLRPHGYNVGMNLGSIAGAGIPDHLHWHVVPRWSGDTNFMPAVGQTRVLPELLADTRARLIEHFEEDG